MKVAHIYACKAHRNSGDFLIGPATKQRFREIVGEKVSFTNFDVRGNFSMLQINNLNKNYDAIILGAGGLILPDTPQGSTVSGWQWNIPLAHLKNIRIPIYVISIGYNTFFTQKMGMTNRSNNSMNKGKYDTYLKHIQFLIKKAKYFSIRHSGDLEKLIKDVGESYRDKISVEFCPTIKYTKAKKLQSKGSYIAFEIKDDRPWRRYHKIGEKQFYEELCKVIDILLKEGEKIAILAHDESKRFHSYLKRKNYKIPKLDNSVANEKKIYENFKKIKTLICTAGHSQMVGHTISGIHVVSLITHPKLLHFCKDMEDDNYILPNENVNFHKDLMIKIMNLNVKKNT